MGKLRSNGNATVAQEGASGSGTSLSYTQELRYAQGSRREVRIRIRAGTGSCSFEGLGSVVQLAQLVDERLVAERHAVISKHYIL